MKDGNLCQTGEAQLENLGQPREVAQVKKPIIDELKREGKYYFHARRP